MTNIYTSRFFSQINPNACHTQNEGRNKKSLSFPTDLILLRLAHLDTAKMRTEAKMSTEMTFVGAKQIKTPCSHFGSMCLI